MTSQSRSGRSMSMVSFAKELSRKNTNMRQGSDRLAVNVPGFGLCGEI